MKTSAWTLASLIALSSSFALAEETAPVTENEAVMQKNTVPAEQLSEQPTDKKLFEKLDSDKDGQISLDEAQNHPTIVKSFNDVDSDKNGFLSPEEFTQPNLKS